MKEITLTLNKVALVSDEDFELINKHKWNADKAKHTFYAVRTLKKKKIYMHRLILGLTDSKIQTDHKDRNGLNNQRDNLRIATFSQNNSNMTAHRNTSSKYKGVSFNKYTKKWGVRIQKNGKDKHIGYFSNEIDAAMAYDKAAIIVHGEFANLNFEISNLSLSHP